ncbi:MAG: YggS family pyridoxal phosphate-dependent enzyme [Deltaproteobacteria bacterium]|nr:YggS family pyridoxal phosphate-dependent enzyme [Deltaproteobacteria bacterium]
MTMDALPDSIEQVRNRIESACLRSKRRKEDILLIAVTKTILVERIQQALSEGLTHFGENYIQEAQQKIDSIQQGTWHFIGHLQKNKAKYAVKLFSMIETVDHAALAQELNRQALQAGKTLEILIQVNEAGESTKSGLPPEQVPSLLQESPAWPALRIRGFMTMPPYDPDPEKSRPWFRSLYHWQAKWRQEFPEMDLTHLSMGMSHDFECAIEEGATIIRVGTALFGSRA